MAREYYSGLIEEFVDSSVEAVLGELTAVAVPGLDSRIRWTKE